MSRHYIYALPAQLLSVCALCLGYTQTLPSAQAHALPQASRKNQAHSTRLGELALLAPERDEAALFPASAEKELLLDKPLSQQIEIDTEGTCPSSSIHSCSGISQVSENATLIAEQQMTVPLEASEAEPSNAGTGNEIQLRADAHTDLAGNELAEDEVAEPSDVDPDLGVLRLSPKTEADSDLGRLRLQPTVEEPPRRPVVYATVRSSAFLSDNTFSSTDPIEDGLVKTGIGLRAVPALGSRTFLIATANGNIVRYFDETDFNYDELELRASIYHRITRRAYIDVGWRNEQFFAESGDRFLSDHQLRASIGRRDRIGPVSINTAYQFRRSFADPNRRSRLLNRLSLSARYPLRSDVDLGISYQLSLIDFTDIDRNDHYSQVLGELSYRPSSTTRLSLFGGGRFGDSSSDFVDFDSALIGITFSLNLPLF